MDLAYEPKEIPGVSPVASGQSFGRSGKAEPCKFKFPPFLRLGSWRQEAAAATWFYTELFNFCNSVLETTLALFQKGR